MTLLAMDKKGLLGFHHNKDCPNVFVQYFLAISNWRIKIYFLLSKTISIENNIM
jgi:hypothetical protein